MALAGSGARRERNEKLQPLSTFDKSSHAARDARSCCPLRVERLLRAQAGAAHGVAIALQGSRASWRWHDFQSVLQPLSLIADCCDGHVLHTRPQEAYTTTLAISNGLFGLQFLLIPKFFLAQFFDKEFDKYHIFLARFMGVLILGQCALLKVCPAETTFPVAAITQLAVAAIGPLTAQFTLNPKMPIHLFPVITTCITTALALAAM